MRILYDGEIYVSQVAGGINRYFSNIISKLPDNFVPTLTTATTRKTNYPSHPNLKTFFYPRHGFRPGRISYWLEKYYFRAVASLQYDLIHPTYYWLLTRQPMSQCRHPIVITVHDMVHEKFSEDIDPDHYVVSEKKKAIESADAIICVSENTKSDLLEIYPTLESRSTVIHHASEIDVTMSYGKEPIPARPYYLYVGGRFGYKNFNTLLMGFAQVISQFPDLSLCVVGSPFNHNEQKLLSELSLHPYVEQISYPSDQHLAKLYRCSLGFVYPSRYEGFGIPLLEAMSCGAPVIAANTSSIPEVVQDAGALFNPESAEDLAEQLLFLINHPSQREVLIEKGYKRASYFSWNRAVAQTIEVYRQVLSL